MRILIIKTSSLGDIIHALPVLSYLRQAAPGAFIDWVVDEAFSDLVSGNPLVDRLLPVAFRRWKKAVFAGKTRHEVMAFITQLRQYQYDLVFDLQGNSKSGMVCWLARSRRKIGFDREHLQEKLNSFFTTEQVSFLPIDRNAVQRYLRIVSAPFALRPDGLPMHSDIATSADDDCFAGNVLAAVGSPVVLFHTGTTWQTKLWFDEGWLQLGQELLGRYASATIVLSWGTDEERQRAEQLAAKLGSRTCLLPRLSLKQFAAVLKRCNLAIGGDTGPVHLAAAVGTATVSFYRCTDGLRNGPYGIQHAIIQSSLPCTVCMRKQCDQDEDCRRNITPTALFEAAERLLMQGKKDTP
ncbi:MAG: lipopolysaccharide heptosyltransferase I [Trichlorobacter sp.]|uniref:lipopolysaccharide heptosyltransferase I n=1 Tax=Trichlorobacter sp. TaxID=2911007 RepID=UPI00256DC6A7|nr:lipopolysaccharide heptosyltransferase I [Trichlorobacter sp.]MDK9718612.1 lipopolysaccharide heptosyltransferase I [Trichlorobacter sp.]